MSADNWTVCPKCGDDLRKKLKEKQVEVREMYGKVSVGEYELAKRELAEIDATEFKETLREDFEIGINRDGLFEVGYKAYCSDCKFNFKYDYKTQVVELTPEEDDA